MPARRLAFKPIPVNMTALGLGLSVTRGLCQHSLCSINGGVGANHHQNAWKASRGGRPPTLEKGVTI